MLVVRAGIRPDEKRGTSKGETMRHGWRNEGDPRINTVSSKCLPRPQAQKLRILDAPPWMATKALLGGCAEETEGKSRWTAGDIRGQDVPRMSQSHLETECASAFWSPPGERPNSFIVNGSAFRFRYPDT
ncbi:hypothetical protein KM043_016687 [Ampulex compressa]|nr:hypothetical protein KM043_016687 [Ampulex compressa]